MPHIQALPGKSVRIRRVSTNPLIHAVETALEELRARLLVDLELEHEYRDALLEFGSPGADAAEELRLKRYREWFLLERPSEALGAIPIERFFEGLSEDQGASAAELYASLRGSRTGVFRVARVVSEDGLLLDDLLGRGQYGVAEAALAAECLPGDLIVGRLYPEDLGQEGEKTLWGVSSAASAFRNDQLREALERDLEAMRARSRGPLRMTQRDLEEMFFCSQVRIQEPGERKALKDLDSARSAAEELFASAGVDRARGQDFLAAIAKNPLPPSDVPLGGDDPLGWILDELAFETNIDLDKARRILGDYWSAKSAEEDRTPASEAVGEPDGPGEAAARALANFDAGRAAGQDLDSLFATLEAELGVEADGPAIAGIPKEALEDGIDGDPAPDFPGVLGALMQEFLWDGARLASVELDAFAQQHRDLELFVQFASFIGNADDLGRQHVELFLGRWIWEEGRLERGGYSAAGALGSMRAFCQWLGDGHQNEVLAEVEGFLATIEPQAARLQGLNASPVVTDPAATRSEFFEFVRKEGPLGCWLDGAGGTFEGPLPGGGEELVSGDMVAAKIVGDELRIQAVYPAIAGPYLKATS